MSTSTIVSPRPLALGVLLLAGTGCADASKPVGAGSGSLLVHNGTVTIAATLDLPPGPGPFPVMVFVPGSGVTTRADDRPAVDIALPQGIGVLRYDKRGLGESTGTFEEVTIDNSVRVLGDRASDVGAIVDHLATLPKVQANGIFLWGTSQGAWVAPLVAAQTAKVAFVIAVNGGVNPVGTVVEYERIARDASLSVGEATQRVASYNGPLGYDPQPTLAALRTPVYWIFGGLDRNTPTQLAVPRLQAIAQPGINDFTIHVYPQMTHDMVDAGTSLPPPTLYPELLQWAAPKLGR